MTHPVCRYAAAAGFVLCAGPLYGAAGDADQAPFAGTQESARAQKQAPEPRAAQKKRSRFDSCRSDARGLKGPERASFMTECLHERHQGAR